MKKETNQLMLFTLEPYQETNFKKTQEKTPPQVVKKGELNLRRYKSSLPKSLNIEIGNFKVISYEWRHKTELKQINGDTKEINVSDWNDCENCEHCNKSIVHIFDVKNIDTNQSFIYGKDCLEKITGITINKSILENPLKHMFKAISDLLPEKDYIKTRSQYHGFIYQKLSDISRKDIKVLSKLKSQLVNPNEIELITTKEELIKLNFKLYKLFNMEMLNIYTLSYDEISIKILDPKATQKANYDEEIKLNLYFPDLKIRLKKGVANQITKA